jgi:hypothetical protein
VTNGGGGGGSGTVNSASLFAIGYYPNSGSNAIVGGNTGITTDGSNDFFVAPTAQTSGSPNLLKITGPAHTTLSAVGDTDVQFALNRTVQFTGSTTSHANDIATVRAIRIDPPTYSFSSTGTQSINNVATFAVSGPPVAGTNAVFAPLGLGQPYSISSQAGLVDFDNLNINMNPAVPTDTPILNLNSTTQANGVATTAQRQVGIRLIMTNNGTNANNAAVGIAYSINNIGSASEAALIADGVASKLGGNAYVLHGQTQDTALDGSGTAACNLYGVVSTGIRKQTPSSSNFAATFIPQNSAAGGGQKMDVGYGFWGPSGAAQSFD